MNIENWSQGKKIMIFSFLTMPLILSTTFLVALRSSWQIEIAPNEKFSPIENKPLFVGLVFFTLGYLFFLGLLFSDNILNLFNKRRSLARR
ncbi:hypothetical protein GOV09_05485 [Candidatus Woesearchaeota archaeon]|nr:hypothetical protein [Candidatus Woesearchaeota archaeon]